MQQDRCPPFSALLRWRPGGWHNGRRGRSHRSGLQGVASLSVGKRASRFCDACDPASCGHGLVSAAATGRDARRDALLGQHPADCVPVILLILHHCGSRRQILEQHISTSEVTALPLTQVEPQGTTFAVADPMELAGHAPLGATDQAGAPSLVEPEFWIRGLQGRSSCLG